MKILNVDIEKAIKRIYEEVYKKKNDELACITAMRLKNYHADLFPVIESWVNGEEPEFEFQGITLSKIMEKEKCGYFSALTFMSLLLAGVIAIESYKTLFL